jgi:hypothetical protein
MTVVLQHRFWDLTVTEERFEVKLTFDGIPERLSVPFAAVKVFFDPSVPYGLQFEEAEAAAAEASDGAARWQSGKVPRWRSPARRRCSLRCALTEKKPRAVRKPLAGEAGRRSGARPPSRRRRSSRRPPTPRPAAASSEPNVVSLDKLRNENKQSWGRVVPWPGLPRPSSPCSGSSRRAGSSGQARG